TVGTSSRTMLTLPSVPTGIKVMPIARISGNTTGNYIFTSGDETDVAPGTSGTVFSAAPAFDVCNPGVASGFVGGTNGSVLTTNTSGQLGGRGSNSSMAGNWVTRGYKDFRRS
ncbi:MAG: hypothetical protein ABSH22_19865, partial [Tepidisphaeraceae bacterium]